LNDYNSLSINGQQHCSPPRQPRVFPSLCDWLDEEVSIEWLADFLRLIHDTPNLDWLLLTKRPELWSARLHRVVREIHDGTDEFVSQWLDGDAPKNVWVLASVENQEEADKRIPKLLNIPATVRGLSVEPMLAPVDIASWGWRNISPDQPRMDWDWVIVGGESGPNARPCDVAWIEGIIGQCKESRVPCFVKQLGQKSYRCGVSGIGSPDGHNFRIRPMGLKDKKGGDPLEWPLNLWVREFPRPIIKN
jgi:protein gp37